jgi:hypothetical protein
MYFKILNENLIHYGFQYKEGLNVDTVPFDPTGTCKAGGLYFSDREHIVKFLHYGTKIATVTVPDDARVYTDPKGSKWKADMIILSDIVQIRNSMIWDDPMFCKIAVVQYGMTLEFVPEELMTEEICNIAVAQSGLALRFVPEELMTEEICKIAVSQYGRALMYVPNAPGRVMRTEEICKLAVKQDGLALQFVPEQFKTEEIYKIAVKQYGYSLQYVPEELRTKELCKIAVEHSRCALKFVPEKMKRRLSVRCFFC